MKKIFQRFAIIVAAVAVVMVPLRLTHAAGTVQFFFDPGVTSAELNTTFSIDILLNSPDELVGYVKTYVSFPEDKLTVTAISTANSAFGTQLEQSADNTNGYAKIARASGVQKGNRLLVATITFQTKETGVAAVSFTNASYASVSAFTANKLTGTVGGSYNITPATTPPTNPPSGGGGGTTTGGGGTTTGGGSTTGGSSGGSTTTGGQTSQNTTSTQKPNTPAAKPGATSTSKTTTTTNTANQSTAETPADPNKLTISGADAASSYTQSTLTWTTNLPASAVLAYGTDPENLDSNQSNDQQLTDHTAALKDLVPGTKYYYHIAAKSADGQEATYDSDFTAKGFPAVITVKNASGKPVKGAQVTIHDMTNETDSDGNAVFDLPEGQFDVAITSGRLKQSGVINIEAKDIPSDGSDPESQNFSFNLPKDNSALLMLGAGGLGGLLLLGVLIFVLAKRRGGIKVTAPESAETMTSRLYTELPGTPDPQTHDQSAEAAMIDQPPAEQPVEPVIPPQQPLPTVEQTPVLPVMPVSAMPPAQQPLPPSQPMPAAPQPPVTQTPVPTIQTAPPVVAPQPAPAYQQPLPQPLQPVQPAQTVGTPQPAQMPQPVTTAPQPTQSPQFSPGPLPPEAQHEDLPHLVARTTPVAQHTQDDMPKDMFELAEEQYHYDEKFKTPPRPKQ